MFSFQVQDGCRLGIGLKEDPESLYGIVKVFNLANELGLQGR